MEIWKNSFFTFIRIKPERILSGLNIKSNRKLLTDEYPRTFSVIQMNSKQILCFVITTTNLLHKFIFSPQITSSTTISQSFQLTFTQTLH